MKFLNVELEIKNIPKLDPEFIPIGSFFNAFAKTANKPIAIEVHRNNGLVSVYDTNIHGTENMKDADEFYVDRLIKTLLWLKGGVEIVICGDKKIFEYVEHTYASNGKRAFDSEFMSRVYEREFVVRYAELSEKVKENEAPEKIGGQWDGCRIGFDAGGSDRKVSAVIDGEAVYSEEVVWFPKTNSDPDYHFNGIVEAFKSAASKMPRVDAIGISSAGIYIDNRTMVASLFIKVPKDDFNAKVKDIYLRAAKEIGDVPVIVANDGDVTALAGAMDLKENNILGIAMGTSQAVGFVDANGNITGWLNELAFAPVDCSPNAMVDEWSGDIGCGVKYFSQDSVIKLAKKAGIELDEEFSPAEKLSVVQKLLWDGDARAQEIYESIGVYLGHSINLYYQFYGMGNLLLLGRVMSGKGGMIILDTANKVLSEEYHELSQKVKLNLPDEKSRRVGQSVAAASLPKL